MSELINCSEQVNWYKHNSGSRVGSAKGNVLSSEGGSGRGPAPGGRSDPENGVKAFGITFPSLQHGRGL